MNSAKGVATLKYHNEDRKPLKSWWCSRIWRPNRFIPKSGCLLFKKVIQMAGIKTC